MTAGLLNTKEVCAIGRAYCGQRARWVDRTQEDKTSKRRSVVWHFWDAKDADALVDYFKRKGVINEITRTGVDADYMKRTNGGEYVRVKALKA